MELTTPLLLCTFLWFSGIAVFWIQHRRYEQKRLAMLAHWYERLDKPTTEREASDRWHSDPEVLNGVGFQTSEFKLDELVAFGKIIGTAKSNREVLHNMQAVWGDLKRQHWYHHDLP